MQGPCSPFSPCLPLGLSSWWVCGWAGHPRSRCQQGGEGSTKDGRGPGLGRVNKAPLPTHKARCMPTIGRSRSMPCPVAMDHAGRLVVGCAMDPSSSDKRWRRRQLPRAGGSACAASCTCRIHPAPVRRVAVAGVRRTPKARRARACPTGGVAPVPAMPSLGGPGRGRALYCTAASRATAVRQHQARYIGDSRSVANSRFSAALSVTRRPVAI